MAEEDLVVPDYSLEQEQEQEQQAPAGIALSDEDALDLADKRRFVVVMQNGRLLGGLSTLVGLLILTLGFGGDGPPAGPDRTSQPHPLHAAWPSDWYVRAKQETPTGDGRPISDLQAGTRGPACTGRNGAVAATNFQATQAGLAVLANGGNAADAAVAVQLALGVAQPESNGLGGGCFIVVYEAATGEVVTIDGREEAPAAFHRHVYCADKSCGEDPACTSCPAGALGFQDRFTGGLAVGVPGTLAAAMRLLSDHGTRSFADVAAPAIDLAKSGITMTNHLFNALRGSISRLALWPASAALFLNPEQTAPVAEVGELWLNPDLADTYEHLAKQGWEDFYSGELAQEIVDAARNAVNPNSERGGLMDMADISGYKAVKRAPTRVNFTNAQGETFEIFGMGMPSSGGATMGAGAFCRSITTFLCIDN
jgi:gamma-glutamyltranspeptidase/glutathione hydrolase